MIYGHQFCLFMQIAKRGEDEAKMNEATSRGGGTVRGGEEGDAQQKPEGRCCGVQKCKVKQTNRTPKRIVVR